jgi:hypothetical protein
VSRDGHAPHQVSHFVLRQDAGSTDAPIDPALFVINGLEGCVLRIQIDARFLLHWTEDEWQHATDTRSIGTAVGVEFVDLQPIQQNAPIRFTFSWLDDNRWEGKDFTVHIQARADTRARKAAHGEPSIRVA